VLRVSWESVASQQDDLKNLQHVRLIELLESSPQALSAVAKFKHLEWLVVRLGDNPTVELEDAAEELITPTNRGSLRGLYVYGTKFDDADLGRITQAERLERLHLTWTGTNYSSTWPLPDPNDIRYNARWHQRSRGPASEKGLRALANLLSLETLRLEGTQIRGPDLVHLHALPRLRHLMIENAPLDDAGVAYINGFRGLTSLCLARTDIRSLRALRWDQLPRLRSVDVSQTNVPWQEIKQLRREHPAVEIRHDFFDQLESYYQRRVGLRAPATAEQLKLLAPLTDLTYLSLNGADIDDEDLVSLKPLTQLHQLDLNRTRISDEGLAHLTCFANLEHLSLDDTNVATLACLRNAAQLRSVSVRNSGLTDPAMSNLASITNLDYISLQGTHVTSVGFQSLAGHPTLRLIWLDAAIVDQTLIDTLQTLPRLQDVILVGEADRQRAEQAAALLRTKLPSVKVY
jgi:hypothetical protein